MNDIVKLITDNGVSLVIVALFLWDWIVNRKKLTETCEQNAKMNEQNTKILNEMKIANENTATSLNLLKQSMANQMEMSKETNQVAKDTNKMVKKIANN